MARFAIVVSLFVSVLIAAAWLPVAAADPAASRIVDRTLTCAVGLFAGVREAKVGAGSGTRLLEDRSKWLSLADAGVGDSRGSFVSVAAGNPLAPDRRSGVVFPEWRLWIRVDDTCRSAPRIPFSRTGLAGGAASQLHDDYDCVSGGRVVVRVRAVFRAPTTLRRTTDRNGQRYLRAAGTMRQGFVAVRSAAGKPLAYAEVFESGKARLFTAGSCVED
jgi:hypothetical protein